jgi:hypothetical protein
MKESLNTIDKPTAAACSIFRRYFCRFDALRSLRLNHWAVETSSAITSITNPKCITATIAISGGWCSTHSRHVSPAESTSATNSLRVAHRPPQNPVRAALPASHKRWSTIHCVIFRNIEAGIAQRTSALVTGSRTGLEGLGYAGLCRRSRRRFPSCRRFRAADGTTR